MLSLGRGRGRVLRLLNFIYPGTKGMVFEFYFFRRVEGVAKERVEDMSGLLGEARVRLLREGCCLKELYYLYYLGASCVLFSNLLLLCYNLLLAVL